jgi:hypothetical protein
MLHGQSCEANKQKMHMHETSSTTVCSSYVASVSDFSHANFSRVLRVSENSLDISTIPHTIECDGALLL